MKKLTIAFGLIFGTLIAFGQHEKSTLGKVCYSEEINGQIVNLDFEPYTYHNRIELKFNSGYQITIKEDSKDQFLDILKKYESFHRTSVADNINSPQLIDNFSPEHLSKGKEVIDSNKLLKIYYTKELKELPGSVGNLIFKIPELKDMFGSASASEQYIFIPGRCVSELIEIFKK